MAKPTDPIQAYDSEGKPIFGYNDKGQPVCYSKRGLGGSKGRCMSMMRMHNGRCRVHGGHTPTGPQAHQFKTGQYAKKLPGAYVDVFLQAADDPQYLSLKNEIAIAVTHISTLLGNLGDGLDYNSWQKLKKKVNKCEELLFGKQIQNTLTALGGEGSTITEFGNLVEEIVKLVHKGADQHKAFMEISQASERMRRLIETEIKKENLERNYIPADEAMYLFGMLTQIVTSIWGADKIGMAKFSDDVNSLISSATSKNKRMALGQTSMVPSSSPLVQDTNRAAEAIDVDSEED